MKYLTNKVKHTTISLLFHWLSEWNVKSRNVDLMFVFVFECFQFQVDTLMLCSVIRASEYRDVVLPVLGYPC